MAPFYTAPLQLFAYFAILSLFIAFGRSDWSDDLAGNNECPGLASSLGAGCSISSDCTKITCRLSGSGLDNKDTTVVIKINKCDAPITLDVTVTVRELGIDWSHNFPSDAVVAVPGFSIPSVAGMYIKVELLDSGSNLHLKMQLLGGSKPVDFYPIKVKLVDSDLPISTYECGIIRWWNDLSVGLKIVLAGVVPLVLLILICTCCCCCCGCCKSKPQAPVVLMAPGPSVVTSTNSNVPMRPFVNEPGV